MPSSYIASLGASHTVGSSYESKIALEVQFLKVPHAIVGSCLLVGEE